MSISYVRLLKEGKAKMRELKDVDRPYNELELKMSNEFVELLKDKVANKKEYHASLTREQYVRYLCKKEFNRCNQYCYRKDLDVNKDIPKFRFLLVSIHNMTDVQIWNFLVELKIK